MSPSEIKENPGWEYSIEIDELVIEFFHIEMNPSIVRGYTEADTKTAVYVTPRPSQTARKDT